MEKEQVEISSRRRRMKIWGWWRGWRGGQEELEERKKNGKEANKSVSK